MIPKPPLRYVLKKTSKPLHATNPPKDDNHRNGAVRDRSQVKNDLIDRWIKRDRPDHASSDLSEKGGVRRILAAGPGRRPG
jgi:hypothetical protein